MDSGHQGNLRVVFGDGEESLIGDGKGEPIEMRISQASRDVLWCSKFDAFK